MAHAYRSTHPAVLAEWERLQGPASEHSREVYKQVEEEQGRRIYVSSRDSVPIGLETFQNERSRWGADGVTALPQGWKWGDGKRESGFMEPRASGPGHKEAAAVIKRLQDAAVRVRRNMHDKFGVPVEEFSGLSLITPGLDLMAGAVYVFFGKADSRWDAMPAMPRKKVAREPNSRGKVYYDWVDDPDKLDKTQYFEPINLSEYYLVKEAWDREHPPVEESEKDDDE